VGDEVLVVIGAGVWRRKQEIGLSVQKPEIEPPGLDSGCAIGNGDGGRWSGLTGSG
jgi:hypothetical protein